VGGGAFLRRGQMACAECIGQAYPRDQLAQHRRAQIEPSAT
jgi:hypothetical protein